jgi:hypothetical protein
MISRSEKTCQRKKDPVARVLFEGVTSISSNGGQSQPRTVHIHTIEDLSCFEAFSYLCGSVAW